MAGRWMLPSTVSRCEKLAAGQAMSVAKSLGWSSIGAGAHLVPAEIAAATL
jgi:hypothetical protein